MAEQATSAERHEAASADVSYGETYYLNYWGGGGPYERNERWLQFFGGVADGIVRDLHPSSVLDAGCAMGFLVEALNERGVDAWGVDISEYAISKAHESVRERCSVASLSEPLPRRYDLITCIEVIEHVPPEETDKVVANLCNATDRLLFSSTPGDYGEPTHLNVRPPESWAAAFAREGFFRDLDRDASWLSPWATLYTRIDEPIAETVRRYERSWWRLHGEISEMREALLALQGRLSNLGSDDGTERSDLLKELDRRGEEIFRLRDHLIGKDSELGRAHGRVAELEDRTQRISSIATRLQSISGLRSLARSGLRKRG